MVILETFLYQLNRRHISSRRSLSEEMPAKIIYYKKVKNGIEVDYSEVID